MTPLQEAVKRVEELVGYLTRNGGPFDLRLATDLRLLLEAVKGREGYVLVPRVVSPAMEDAHFKAHATAETVFADVQTIWSAMIEAAPPPALDGEGR